METSQENLGRTAAKAATVVQPSLGTEILSKLEGHSSTFHAVNESFLKFLEKRGKTFKSITFYEKSAVSIKGEVSGVILYFFLIFHYVSFHNLKITVERESARMDNRDHDLLGLNTNHCNMSKYVQLEDPNYMAISNAINFFYEDPGLSRCLRLSEFTVGVS